VTRKPEPCQRCQINPAGYWGRKFCYQCVANKHRRPDAEPPQRICTQCAAEPVAYPGRRHCYRCVPNQTRPALCRQCGTKPVAYSGRRHCFDCTPRRRMSVLRCKGCGSEQDYYTAGRCRRCHRAAPVTDSCRDCLGWGVTRRYDWMCQGCIGWRKRFPTPSLCPSCHRHVPINARGFCRLCSRQANLVRPRHGTIDVLEANRHGQQLFIVDLFRHARDVRTSPPHPLDVHGRYPVTHQQPTLFDISRDMAAGRRRGFGEPPLPDLAALMDRTAIEHAATHGWSKDRELIVRAGIRVLLAIQQTPGALIKASEAALLPTAGYRAVGPVITILGIAGMLDDDRVATIEIWFQRRIEELPESIRSELTLWFRYLVDGSRTPPRGRPRNQATIRIHVTRVTDLIAQWHGIGRNSLREITRADVQSALAAQPRRHHGNLAALRSLFGYLAARRVIFANPTARLRGPSPQLAPPVPTDLAPVRRAISNSNPARAALATLIAFHALRPTDLADLQLTDVRDGRLHLAGRAVLLAEPARVAVAAWLDRRAQRWPNTINAHLFINQYSAIRLRPVGTTWIRATVGIAADAVRQDRILDEAIATGGDVRRLCDMFGITVQTAERYARALDKIAEAGSGSATDAPR
jgi:site-specific recombinase XerC